MTTTTKQQQQQQQQQQQETKTGKKTHYNAKHCINKIDKS